MKSKLVVGLFISILALGCAQAQVQVTLGNISDFGRNSKSNGNGFFAKEFGGLHVGLHLHGDAVATAKSVDLKVTSAIDDTGADLAKSQFSDMNFFKGNSPDLLTDINLKEPAAGAKTIKVLTGEVELYEPQNDPASTVTVPSFLKTIGAPISSPTLAAAGVQVTVTGTTAAGSAMGLGMGGGLAIPGVAVSGSVSMTGSASYSPATTGTSGDEVAVTPTKRKFRKRKRQNQNGPQISISMKVSDPNEKIAGVQMQDASGRKIDATSTMTFTMFGNETKTYTFALPFPDDAQMVIYLSTPKSSVKVPFSFSNVALP
jgi:hypothetical protein